MTTLTKLLPENARPAKALLERAHPLTMTYSQRSTWTDTLETAEGVVSVRVDEPRALEIDDVFVDEVGQFYVVCAAEEPVLFVKGDIPTMQEAAQALMSRDVPVASGYDGFYVLPMSNIAKMLKMIGLSVEEQVAKFEPVRPEPSGGCGCGGSCSCDSGGCGCGGHDHDQHHHDHSGCGCGGHDHDQHHHDHGGCGCGGHDHDHGHGHEHDHGGSCCHSHGEEEHHHHEGSCCHSHDGEEHHHHEDSCCHKH